MRIRQAQDKQETRDLRHAGQLRRGQTSLFEVIEQHMDGCILRHPTRKLLDGTSTHTMLKWGGSSNRTQHGRMRGRRGFSDLIYGSSCLYWSPVLHGCNNFASFGRGRDHPLIKKISRNKSCTGSRMCSELSEPATNNAAVRGSVCYCACFPWPSVIITEHVNFHVDHREIYP